jgi:hypothetical protein
MWLSCTWRTTNATGLYQGNSANSCVEPGTYVVAIPTLVGKHNSAEVSRPFANAHCLRR